MVNKFKNIPKFFIEVKDELKKVNWSSRKEIIGAAVIVIIVSAALSIYLAVLDAGLGKGAQIFLQK